MWMTWKLLWLSKIIPDNPDVPDAPDNPDVPEIPEILDTPENR